MQVRALPRAMTYGRVLDAGAVQDSLETHCRPDGPLKGQGGGLADDRAASARGGARGARARWNGALSAVGLPGRILCRLLVGVDRARCCRPDPSTRALALRVPVRRAYGRRGRSLLRGVGQEEGRRGEVIHLPHWVSESARRLGEATFKRALPWFRRAAGRVVETDSLRAVLNPTSGYGPPAWHEAGTGGEAHRPLMQVRAIWTFTNLTNMPLQIAAVYLRIKPRTYGSVMLHHPTRNEAYFGPLRPGVPTGGSSNFMVDPPRRKPGQDLKATVVFVDNLGNECPVPGVVFKGPSGRT